MNSAVGQTAESDTTGSFSVIETSMERLNQLNEEVLTLWKDQNMKLEMYVQWKIWERDALEVGLHFQLHANFEFRLIYEICFIV